MFVFNILRNSGSAKSFRLFSFLIGNKCSQVDCCNGPALSPGDLTLLFWFYIKWTLHCKSDLGRIVLTMNHVSQILDLIEIIEISELWLTFQLNCVVFQLNYVYNSKIKRNIPYSFLSAFFLCSQGLSFYRPVP